MIQGAGQVRISRNHKVLAAATLPDILWQQFKESDYLLVCRVRLSEFDIGSTIPQALLVRRINRALNVLVRAACHLG